MKKYFYLGISNPSYYHPRPRAASSVPEKVWFHGEWCSSRGRNCYNTRLTSEGGCCIWYNEPQCVADIEDHLGVTIQQVGGRKEICRK